MLAVVESGGLAPARLHAYYPPVDFAILVARDNELSRRGRRCMALAAFAFAGSLAFAFALALALAFWAVRLGRVGVRSEGGCLLSNDGVCS